MIAAHFTWEESIAWTYDDRTGGEKDRAGLFDRFNVKSIFWSYSVTEQEYVSNKLIIEAKDYKGLNFRGVGWTGFVLAEPEFGASGIVIPSADVYTALQTGVIDACEVGSVFGNMNNGFHEVCKYGGWPGMHQLSQTGSLLVSGKAWASLPPDIQEIFQRVCNARPARTNSFNLIECARAMDRREANGNVEVRESPAAQRTWRDVSWRIADRMGDKSPEFKALWGRMKDYMNAIRPYMQIQTPVKAQVSGSGIFKWSELKKKLK
jgi:TRAP-type mannitol/chloroaromatic compound transport system substrate-binding protein